MRLSSLRGLADAASDAAAASAASGDSADSGWFDWTDVNAAASGAPTPAEFQQIDDQISAWLDQFKAQFALPWWVYAGGAGLLFLAWHHEFRAGRPAFG
jgi:hypothetical protein